MVDPAIAIVESAPVTPPAITPDAAPQIVAPVVNAPPERPDFLSDKYKTVEDQARAYPHLEKLLGMTPAKRASAIKNFEQHVEAKEIVKANTKPIEGGTVGELAVSTVLANKGMSYADMEAEYAANNGSLLPETIARLKVAGFDESVVNEHIELRKTALESKAVAFQKDAYAEAGLDAESFAATQEWATNNLPQEAIEYYNTAVHSMNTKKAAFAMRGLQAEYERVHGSDPKLIMGGRGSAGLDRYESTAQLVKDQMSEDYARDPAFREKVYAKIKRSNI